MWVRVRQVFGFIEAKPDFMMLKEHIPALVFKQIGDWSGPY